jgi:hypothetical protein
MMSVMLVMLNTCQVQGRAGLEPCNLTFIEGVSERKFLMKIRISEVSFEDYRL